VVREAGGMAVVYEADGLELQIISVLVRSLQDRNELTVYHHRRHAGWRTDYVDEGTARLCRIDMGFCRRTGQNII
jgi:hypothetical protein